MNSSDKCIEKQMLQFEEKHNVRIPSSFRSFLKKSNGIVWDGGICISIPSVSVHIYVDALFGLGLANKWLDMDYWLEKYSEELPSETLIIGSDVLEGFIIILNLPETNGVFYWDDKLNLAESTDQSNCYYICDSVEDFLKKLYAQL